MYIFPIIDDRIDISWKSIFVLFSILILLILAIEHSLHLPLRQTQEYVYALTSNVQQREKELEYLHTDLIILKVKRPDTLEKPRKKHRNCTEEGGRC